MQTLYFEAVAKINNQYAVGAAFKSNRLFEIEIKSGKCKYIGMISNECFDGKRLYTTACNIEGKVYFVPAFANEIAVYDIKNKQIYKIAIDEKTNFINYDYKLKFNGCVRYNNFIYLIPCTYPGIIRIDTITDQLEYFDSWCMQNVYLFRKETEVVGSKIYVSSTINNFVLEFDMIENEGRLYKIGKNNKGSWCIKYIDGYFWMASAEGNCFIRWDKNQDICEEYGSFPSNFIGDKHGFTKIYELGDRIYVLPGVANMGVYLEKATKKICCTDVGRLIGNDITQYMFQIDEYVYLCITKDGIKKGYRLNITNNRISEYEFSISENEHLYKKDYMDNLYQKNYKIVESTGFDLRDWIEGLVTDYEY